MAFSSIGTPPQGTGLFGSFLGGWNNGKSKLNQQAGNTSGQIPNAPIKIPEVPGAPSMEPLNGHNPAAQGFQGVSSSPKNPNEGGFKPGGGVSEIMQPGLGALDSKPSAGIGLLGATK